MMEYISAISYFFTNEVRLFLGLFLVVKVMNFLPKKMLLLLSAAGGVLVTALQMAGLPTIGVLTVELLVITAVTWYCLRDKLNLCLFLIFFYEVGVGLWDFLLQAGLGIMFRSENFINPNAMEYLAGIWLVRLLMLIGSITLIKQEHPNAGTLRALSVLVILGMFGAVTLSEQTILPLNEDQVGTWIILSIILLFAILFYRVNQQREMEAEIAKLKQEQAEIVERDYQALRRTYADNAKLYHDLHNHIEAIYQCLIQGDTKEAVRYCEDLRTPVRQISQTVWTGDKDKALDYLISSKMALAGQEQIKTKVNIEYPHNTNCLFIFAVNSIVASIYLCSWQIVNGGFNFVHVGTLLIFALQSAILSVILEWKHPIRDWKTESDLWHHPRKYLVPLIMLLAAAFVGTWTLALWICATVLLMECCVLLFVTRRG